MGNCPMAHETQTGVLNQPRRVGWGGRWEGGSKGRGYMYTYGWFMLRCDRKQQNSIKQLSFNKNKFKKKLLMCQVITKSLACNSERVQRIEGNLQFLSLPCICKTNTCYYLLA